MRVVNEESLQKTNTVVVEEEIFKVEEFLKKHSKEFSSIDMKANY